ncbi:Membrane attack complex component/perforin [Sesbania bispinosa]|nr:Membrane attack complex component/perforin [Sesbania bispinosa]
MGDGIVERALNSLGKGFDLTSDFSLKFCKGEKRLVVLNETERRELTVPGFGPIKDVSIDIKCDKGDRTRYSSDILTFTQMSELFNQKSSIPGKIPSGYFNAVFGFDGGSWATDAANTKYLALDGYFIILFNVHIDRCPLVVSKQVLEAVPSSWDPPALARFIKKFGTHILVGLSIGGKDLIFVKQDVSSTLPPSELKKHLHELGDQLFTGTCNFLPKTCKDQKHKVPQAFDVFGPQSIAFNSFSTVCEKDRGGNRQVSNHCEWLLTVPEKPDAVHFSFIPITSLLDAIPGNGFLSHAINLYLRCPKLYVNTTKVTVGNRPITGMRLFLEGMKCNRLAIHLQHLLNTPMMLESKIEDTIWTQEISHDNRFFEALNGKKFSHVCTAPVKYNPTWCSNKDVAFIVTGAQLHVNKHDSKSVLHLRLLFSKSSSIFSAISTSISGKDQKQQEEELVLDSSVFPTGPPVPVQTQKLLKFVNMSQLCKGPQDSPGHWLVTGARLVLEKGNIKN